MKIRATRPTGSERETNHHQITLHTLIGGLTLRKQRDTALTHSTAEHTTSSTIFSHSGSLRVLAGDFDGCEATHGCLATRWRSLQTADRFSLTVETLTALNRMTRESPSRHPIAAPEPVLAYCKQPAVPLRGTPGQDDRSLRLALDNEADRKRPITPEQGQGDVVYGTRAVRDCSPAIELLILRNTISFSQWEELTFHRCTAPRLNYYSDRPAPGPATGSQRLAYSGYIDSSRGRSCTNELVQTQRPTPQSSDGRRGRMRSDASTVSRFHRVVNGIIHRRPVRPVVRPAVRWFFLLPTNL